MTKTLQEIRILKKAIQEVYSFLYWEVPMVHYQRYDKIVKIIMERLEEMKKECQK